VSVRATTVGPGDHLIVRANPGDRQKDIEIYVTPAGRFTRVVIDGELVQLEVSNALRRYVAYLEVRNDELRYELDALSAEVTR
jgi:hypothetical protein